MTSEQDTEAEDEGWGGPSAIVAGVLLATIALIAVWVVWPGGDGDGDGGQAGTTTTSTSEPASRASEGGSDGVDEHGCPDDLPTGERVPPAGPRVEWTLFRGLAVPGSEEHGPAVIEGDVARCYSHTPTGALIAAVQIGSRYVVATDGVDVARRQTVPGKGQDALVAALQERGPVQVQSGDVCQMAGFRFVDFTPEEAVIARASRCPDGVLQLTEVKVRWSDGDWKLVLLDDGSESATASTLNDLSGMTAWSGV